MDATDVFHKTTQIGGSSLSLQGTCLSTKAVHYGLTNKTTARTETCLLSRFCQKTTYDGMQFVDQDLHHHHSGLSAAFPVTDPMISIPRRRTKSCQTCDQVCRTLTLTGWLHPTAAQAPNIYDEYKFNTTTQK